MNHHVRAALLAVVLIAGITPTVAVAQNEGDPCTAPGLLTRNCRFQRPTYGVGGFGVLYHDWTPYIVSGSPQFDANYHGNSYDPDDLVNGGREQSMFSPIQGTWRAGLFQRIDNVTPGRAYYARIGWFVSVNGSILGRVGIDPDGGTDPNSPSVAWSGPLPLFRTTQHRLRGVYARGTSITVFVDASNGTPSGGDDRLWLTAVAVAPDTAYALADPTATPTSTPRPLPSRSPTPRVPTLTQTPTATMSPTASPTPTETSTPTAEPTATATPEPTATRRPRPTLTPTPAPSLAGMLSSGMALGVAGVAGIGGCGLLGMLGVGGVGWMTLRRARRRNSSPPGPR